MSKYYLVIDDRSKQYKKIDLTKLNGFDKKNAFSLESIVDFTTSFPNIEKLKIELYNNNLIGMGDLNKKLAIIYPYKKEMKKLKNGISLSGDKKYFDQMYLIHHIHSKKNDFKFLEQFCNNYRNSHYKTVVNDLIVYTRALKNNIVDEDLNELFSVAVEEFVIKETGLIDKKSGKYKVNYKKLRDLAMYVSYLNKSLNENINKKNNFEYEQHLFSDISKKEELIEVNFEESDEIKRLYDEGFPPNSEELRIYKRYLESLPDENYSFEEHKNIKKKK